MLEKIKEMLGSVRFWYSIGLGLVIYLKATGMDPALANALEAFFIAGITVRTVDSAAEKVGGQA